MKILTGAFKDILKILLEKKLREWIDHLRLRFIDREISVPPEPVLPISILSGENQTLWALEQLGIKNLWSVSQGEGIKIAILDTGVATHHPDLVDAIVKVQDFTSDHDPEDHHGHGTHVAGICAARDTGRGMIGVAPKAKLYCGKVLSNGGSGDFEWITQGIEWAISENVDIISMSLGCRVPYGRMYSAIQRATTNGIIVVAAAGNDGERGSLDTIGYPGRYDEVIAVGSVDPTLVRSGFSSVGREIDIMAPGGRIYSCYPPNGYSILNGTSMACPFISGICALVLAKHRKHGGSTPINNYRDMLEHLKKFSRDMETPGWDDKTGWGLIDPAKIVGD